MNPQFVEIHVPSSWEGDIGAKTWKRRGSQMLRGRALQMVGSCPEWDHSRKSLEAHVAGGQRRQGEQGDGQGVGWGSHSVVGLWGHRWLSLWGRKAQGVGEQGSSMVHRRWQDLSGCCFENRTRGWRVREEERRPVRGGFYIRGWWWILLSAFFSLCVVPNPNYSLKTLALTLPCFALGGNEKSTGRINTVLTYARPPPPWPW